MRGAKNRDAAAGTVESATQALQHGDTLSARIIPAVGKRIACMGQLKRQLSVADCFNSANSGSVENSDATCQAAGTHHPAEGVPQ